MLLREIEKRHGGGGGAVSEGLWKGSFLGEYWDVWSKLRRYSTLLDVYFSMVPLVWSRLSIFASSLATKVTPRMSPSTTLPQPDFRHSCRGSVPQLALTEDVVLFWGRLDTHRPIKSMAGLLMPLFGVETPVPSSSGTYSTHNGPESMSAAVRWRFSAMAPFRRIHLPFASLQLVHEWVVVAVERYRSISLR